jgi:hypothetical protein
MALPRNAEQARVMLEAWRNANKDIRHAIMYGGGAFFDSEPLPHKVYYRGGKVTYLPPDRYMLRRHKPSPSDCVWIVPGTLDGT